MYSVLLVEDDIQLTKIVKRILEGKDFIVQTVADGKEALDLIKNKDFDFYLIDINIPSVNGLELVKYIKELKKRGKIIMLTAASEDYYFKTAYDYGCDDYIKKPFELKELELRIKRLVFKKTNKIKITDDYEFDVKKLKLFYKFSMHFFIIKL